MEYRYGSHTIYNIRYHFVFVTKYRYQVLKGDIGLKARELIRQTCQAFEIEIIKGVVSKDHVHLFCLSAANYDTKRSDASNQGEKFGKAVRKYSRFEAPFLGATFLGKRLLLCYIRRVDRRDD